MGLGSLRKVSLAEARRKAADGHKLLEGHVDPIGHRKAARTAAVLTSAKTITFKEAAAKYIAMRSKGLKNTKHAAQWGTTIATYAEPVLGKLPVRRTVFSALSGTRLLACLIVAPQQGYDEPGILSYAIRPFCPTNADGLHIIYVFVVVARI